MLEDVFDGDARKINLLKNAVRSSVTYDTAEAMAAFLYGEGSPGKSKLMEVLKNPLKTDSECLNPAF